MYNTKGCIGVPVCLLPSTWDYRLQVPPFFLMCILGTKVNQAVVFEGIVLYPLNCLTSLEEKFYITDFSGWQSVSRCVHLKSEENSYTGFTFLCFYLIFKDFK